MMAPYAQISPIENRPAATPVERGSARDREPAGADGVDARAEFSALLALTRAAQRLTVQEATPKTSASQMFEAEAGDAHQRRLGHLKSGDRSDGPVGGDDRLNPTGVAARRADELGRRGETQPWSSREPASASATDIEDVKNSTHARSVIGSGIGKGATSSQGSSSASSRTSRMEGADATQMRSARNGMSKGAGLGQLTSPAAGSAGAVALSASATSSPTGAAGQRAATPAQNVAQILGAGRGGEAESMRAATPSPHASSGRPSTAQQRGATNTTLGSSTRNPSSTQSGRGPREVESSAFDRFVRSIRLQPGFRRSSARLHLDPPELGKVIVDVRMVDDDLRISVRAETADARKLLAERVTSLRAALAQHGIQVDHFSVTTDSLDDATPDFDEQGGAEVAEQHERGMKHRSSPDLANDPWIRDVGVSADPDAEPASTADAEARLDIRV